MYIYKNVKRFKSNRKKYKSRSLSKYLKNLQVLITTLTPRPKAKRTTSLTLKPRPTSRQVPTLKNNLKGRSDKKYRISEKNALHDWYDWLINHIPESIKRHTSNVKEKIISLFATINKDRIVDQKQMMVFLMINT